MITNERKLPRRNPLLVTALVALVASLAACAGAPTESVEEDTVATTEDGLTSAWCQSGTSGTVGMYRAKAWRDSSGVYIWFEAGIQLGTHNNTVTTVKDVNGNVVSTISSPDNIKSYTKTFIHGRYPGKILYVKAIFDKPNAADPSCTVAIDG